MVRVLKVHILVGDVPGWTCAIMDEVVYAANTLCKGASAPKERGALNVRVSCTQPVLAGAAVSRSAEPDLDEPIVTRTIPLYADAQAALRARQISFAQLLGAMMTRISSDESVLSLFTD